MERPSCEATRPAADVVRGRPWQKRRGLVSENMTRGSAIRAEESGYCVFGAHDKPGTVVTAVLNAGAKRRRLGGTRFAAEPEQPAYARIGDALSSVTAHGDPQLHCTEPKGDSNPAGMPRRQAIVSWLPTLTDVTGSPDRGDDRRRATISRSGCWGESLHGPQGSDALRGIESRRRPG